MPRFYDELNKRLVYVTQSANPGFWDKHWEKYNLDKIYARQISRFDYVVNNTKKYIPKGAYILEGGCGLGLQVFKLQNAGFNAIGVDYAEKTVEFVRKSKPGLDIRLGDVTKLSFENSLFDAYWSFGVIEHFYDGYNRIAREMLRVIKPGGYLFLTFPHMSALRKLKARLGQYPKWNEQEKDDFYQFALNSTCIIRDFKEKGFKLICKTGMDGTKGLKDEIKLFKPILQKIYNSRSLVGMGINKIISILFSKFASHSVLLVLKKEK